MNAVVRAMRPEEYPQLREFLYLSIFVHEGEALPGRESVRLYRGRATAIVRADGTGRVVLKAEADGLKKGRASVRIKPVKAQS